MNYNKPGKRAVETRVFPYMQLPKLETPYQTLQKLLRTFIPDVGLYLCNQG